MPWPISSVTSTPSSISAISSATEIPPASRWTFAVEMPGAPPCPREAWPVRPMPSWRAAAALVSQPVILPFSTSARGAVARPSPSTGRERSPRLRSGSSRMRIAAGNRSSSSRPEQEARLARHRAARHPAQQMPEQRIADPGIEHHAHRLRRHPARVEPRDRALAGGRGRSACGVSRSSAWRASDIRNRAACCCPRPRSTLAERPMLVAE